MFGGGNKLIHNVVGGIGVLQGNGGTLRPGLPWQAVHDGESLAHEPLRLSVMIEAPAEAIAEVLAAHDGVRALFDNGWLSLFTLAERPRQRTLHAGPELAGRPAIILPRKPRARLPRHCRPCLLQRGLDLAHLVGAHFARGHDGAVLDLPQAEGSGDVAILVEGDGADHAFILDGLAFLDEGKRLGEFLLAGMDGLACRVGHLRGSRP